MSDLPNSSQGPPQGPPQSVVTLSDRTVSPWESINTSSIGEAEEVSDYDSDDEATDSDDEATESKDVFEPKDIFKLVKTKLLEREGVDVEGRYDTCQQRALVFIKPTSWKLANITEDVHGGGFFNAHFAIEQATFMLHTRTLGEEQKKVLLRIQLESRKAIQDELTNVSENTRKAVVPKYGVLWEKWIFLETILRNGKRFVIMKDCVIGEDGKFLGKVVGKGILLFGQFPDVYLLSGIPEQLPAVYTIHKSDLQSGKFHIKEDEEPSAKEDLGVMACDEEDHF